MAAAGRNGRWFVEPSCSDESAMSQHDSPDDSLRRRRVETWRRAGEDLALLRQLRSNPSTPKRLSGRFSEETAVPAPSSTSGLVEQQAWFARMQRARRK